MNLEIILMVGGMAAITWATRAVGLILADRLPRTGFFAQWLEEIPGSVLAALVVPNLVTGGYADGMAGIVTIVVMWFTRNVLAAMISGVIAAYAARTFLASF